MHKERPLRAGKRKHSWLGLDPRLVVERFCYLDGQGARLGTIHRDKSTADLVAWDAEPCWKESTAIRWYEVGDAKVYGNHSHVPVRYWVLAAVTPQHLERLPTDQKVVFRLVRRNHRWVIDAPLFEPHVLVLALRRHLGDLAGAGKIRRALTRLR